MNKLEMKALDTDSIAVQRGPTRSEVVKAAGEMFCKEKGFGRSVRAIVARIARNDCLEKKASSPAATAILVLCS